MMRSSALTYSQLEYLLTELGYHLTSSPNEGGHIWHLWENPQSNAAKFLPAETLDEPARRDHLITIRKVSIENGIIEAGAFEELLDKARQRGIEPTANRNVA